VSAYDVHEWINAQLRLLEEQICLIKIDGPRRRVYIKVISEEQMRVTLHATGGQQEYKHENGEISTVMIEVAGMCTRKVRIAYLAPEIPDAVVRAALTKYGDVKDITEEKWARQYRYAVSNGIRVAIVNLETYVPSHFVIAGTIVLVSYEGQPVTCYNCNATGHR
jgi:hypothetical protein